jgi:DMSO reductase family type II enzyme chaperone
MTLATLDTTVARAAAGRSRLYQFLALAFAFPDKDLYDAVRDGSFAETVASICEQLPYEVDCSIAAELRAVPEAYGDFESEYIRLFDVGPSGPPCPLYGGVYVGDRMKVMEDATRFYNFFSLHLSPEQHELPDHITTQLEFLHYLTFREAEVRETGVDAAPLLRAERDFLSRHLCKWVPQLQSKLAKQGAGPFFPALVRFAAAFFERDRAYAAAAAA